MKSKVGSPLRAAFVVATAFAVLPTIARAQDVFVVTDNDVVGEYSASGATINSAFATLPFDYCEGIAAWGGDLFVPQGFDKTIGEYDGTTGATINSSLISDGGTNLPAGIAISDGNIFVTNGSLAGGGSVGEYTTSGGTVNASLITGLDNPNGIVVAGNDLFVVNEPSGYAQGSIGEYNATTGATINASLVTGLSNPTAIALSGGDLFVTSNFTNSVAEYSTSGALVNASLITGLNDPQGITAYGGNLFITNFSGGNIGEYTTTGATVNASLISGIVPIAIAVVPTPEPSTLVMLAIGAAGLLAAGVRRRMRQLES